MGDCLFNSTGEKVERKREESSWQERKDWITGSRKIGTGEWVEGRKDVRSLKTQQGELTGERALSSANQRKKGGDVQWE